MKITEPELDSLFESLEKTNFVVLGDFCLDAYYFLDNTSSEISIETGLKTLAVKSMRFTPGGAGNVAANLTAMGARHVYGLGVVGDDLFGREYLTLLSSAGINIDHMIVQKDSWQTCVYTKLYEAGQERPRIDHGNFNRLEPRSASGLLERLSGLLPEVDLVLINQQLVNGIHTPEFREELQEIIRTNDDKIFLLDSRDYNEVYQGTLRKLNDREAALTAGLDCTNLDYSHIDNVCRAARILYRRWGTPVFITRAERGSLVQAEGKAQVIPGLHLLARLDTVGAGDSILAGLAGGLAAGFSSGQALLFASFVAGVTIQKLFQTGTAGQEEIRVLARAAEFRLNPEKAESLRTADYWSGTEIEIVKSPGKRKIAFAVFDHDGTISTLREGWEAVMEPVMVQAILGTARYEVSEEIFNQITAEVREYIDKTTGIRTLVQMVELTRIIKDRGFVPQEEILDPRDYKQLYLSQLDLMIKERMAKIKRREMEVSDFTIKGALEFLEMLRDNGLTLFLASGTDEEDVHQEASFLGYADLFNGGIFGARDTSTDEPKKAVLEMILSDIGPEKSERIVTFGDGPVEMRETWKVGGGCVGVASDEIRRFGLNRHKRQRLILAGAEIIIPDFSQGRKLYELLFTG